MLHPLIRRVDEEVADRILAMRTYLINGGIPDGEATQLTSAAFTGHAVPFFISQSGHLCVEDPDAPPPPDGSTE